MHSRLIVGFSLLVVVGGCQGKPIGRQTATGRSLQGTLTLAVTGPAEVKGSVSFESLLELAIAVEAGPGASVHLLAQERRWAAVGCA